MPFWQIGSLRAFQFESLTHPGLTQAIFTRRGGVSPEPWRSLNVGGAVGDERARVMENRRRSFEAVGRPLTSVYDSWQVHSAEVIVVTGPRGDGALIQADALITDSPEATLHMRFADCVPILLFDPVRGAVGIVHAGWLGTVRQAASAAVQAMQRTFGSRAADLLAGIGPSIGPDHYAVREDVGERIREVMGAEAARCLRSADGNLHLDLWEANRLLLERQGLGSIEVAGICTACHLEDWYSHRGEHGRTGRFGGLIALNG